MDMTALNWDAWRTAYPAMTYAEQQAFHTAIYERYPEQRHYDSALAAKAIEDTNAKTIVELGGWDGELAEDMLTQYPEIRRWRNIELCKEAAEAGQGRHPRYSAPTLTDWYWTRQWTCDLFIASHSIEHLSLAHLDKTIEATDAKALFFDAPLVDRPYQWRGFTGTHILQTGWAGVTSLCEQHGYTLTWAQDHLTDPSSGGHARACLYTRAPLPTPHTP